MGLVCGLWCDKYPTDEHMKCLVGFSYFKTHCLPLDFVASVSLQMKTVVCVCTNVYSSSWDLCSNCQEIHGHSSDRGFPHVLTRMVQRVQCHQCRRRQHHHARWERRRQFFEQGFQLLNYVKLHMFLQTIKNLQRFRTGSKKWPSF